MKRSAFVFSFFFSALVAFAQTQPRKLTVTPYASNIFKVKIAAPRPGWHNENVSDAVLLKPAKSISTAVDYVFKDDRILLNKRVDIAVFDSADYSGLTIALKPGEKVFGGGERALPLNRRGYRLPLYNNPWYGYGEGADALNYSVPFVTSSEGYGLFFDNAAKGFLDIGKTNANALTFGAVSGEINVYVIFGDYQTVLQSYHKLTGTQPLPPRWALGHLLSRFGYTSEAQVKEIYAKTKAEGIPVDAVIFDLFWFGDSIKGTLGNLDWVNRKAWPAPKQMIADFKKDGVNTILVTEPFFLEGTKNYNASKPFLAVDSSGTNPFTLTDFYFGRGGLIDIFRNDSKAFFWRFYKQQMDNGVEGWWGDLGEPEKHPSTLYHNLNDLGHKRLFGADEVHNVFGHNWTKMLHDFYAKEYPNKRLFSLNRSGFAGTQRYSIFPWTGDVSRSWSGLRAQLPILLGMSMSGVPYVHSDAGGFAGGEGDPELYVRWLQFAVFTPIFRPHGTALYNVEPAAFSWPSEVALAPDSHKEDAKLAVKMRYAMLPYNYSLAYQHAKFGRPLMAPLYYHFPTDTAAAGVQDEYMWGENLLVAPVLQKGVKSRKVYLPKGKWFSATNELFEGGRWIDVSTELGGLSVIPIFAKEGSIVPGFSFDNRNATQLSSANGNQMLSYFVSTKSTSFAWYNDDGVSKNALAAGNYTLVNCTGQDQGKKIKLTLAPSNKRYLKNELVVSIIGLGKQPASVFVNGRPMNAAETGPFPLEKSEAANTAHWRNGEKRLELHTQFGNAKQLVIEIVK